MQIMGWGRGHGSGGEGGHPVTEGSAVQISLFHLSKSGVVPPPCLQCHSGCCMAGCECLLAVGEAEGAHWQPRFFQPAPGWLWLHAELNDTTV